MYGKKIIIGFIIIFVIFSSIMEVNAIVNEQLIKPNYSGIQEVGTTINDYIKIYILILIPAIIDLIIIKLIKSKLKISTNFFKIIKLLEIILIILPIFILGISIFTGDISIYYPIYDGISKPSTGLFLDVILFGIQIIVSIVLIISSIISTIRLKK